MRNTLHEWGSRELILNYTETVNGKGHFEEGSLEGGGGEIRGRKSYIGVFRAWNGFWFRIQQCRLPEHCNNFLTDCAN
jgi:hypothetical protein